MKLKILSSVSLILMLAGCASVPAGGPVLSTSAETLRQTAERNPVGAPPRARAQAEQPVEPVVPTLVKGSDIMIGTPSSRGALAVRGEAVSLRFEQAPMTEVVHAVFGDLLKLDYSLVTPLTGELTLHTQAPVPRDQVLPLLESALKANGISMVTDLTGRYQIGRSEALKGSVPVPRRTEALAAGGGSVIVPLQFIGATEMADILRPVASPESLLRVDTVRNLLMLSGTRQQLDGWLEIINTFDVDFLKGMSIGLFPLANSSVKDVDAALKSVLGSASVTTLPSSASSSSAQRQGETTRSASGAPAQSAAQGGDEAASPFLGLIRVVPIERLNALLVITPRAHYLEQARIWIERFDRPADSDVDGQLYVYPVQNGSAQHLANLLNGLYGSGQTSSSGSAAATRTGVTPSLSSTTQSSLGTGSSMSGSMGSLNASGNTAAAGTTGQGATVTQVSLDRGVKVVADDHNNALLIHASRSEYRRIESALRRLDVSPTQVLIEASIIEVTLTDALKYGLQWHFQDNLRGGWKGLGQLVEGESGAISALGAGFSYSVVNPAGSVRAVLSALADKSLLNVLSNPNVMVLDNHTATIQVGDQQPIQTASSVSEDGGLRTSSIQYKDTGVLLTVTPSVNAGDMVSMTVNQAITDVGDRDTATGQRSFNQRQINSRVAVRSGQTIVLGGLIRDNKTRGRQGIPLLHDIPVVGNLFGATTVDTVRTELLVLITPRVVRSEVDVDDVSAEMRERVRLLRSAEGLAGEEMSRLLPGRPMTDGATTAIPVKE